MKHIVIYVHGKGGSAEEAEHYRALFPGAEVIGFDYRAQTPWEAKERLIGNMMQWAGVTEQELAEKQEIPTQFGETLSMQYLRYVREHPVSWHVPTRILYGEHDNLTSMQTICAFAGKTGAALTVMPGGEHWFHTEAQMQFLDRWLQTRPEAKV